MTSNYSSRLDAQWKIQIEWNVRKNAKRLVLLVVVFAVLVVALRIFSAQTYAQGNSYYVSTSGSDTNPGTLSSPFKTIAKGVSAVNAGDTLYIVSGTYNE